MIVLPIDLISAVPFTEVIDVHEGNKADLTMFLKQKKEYSQGEKKPDADLEPCIDIGLIGGGGEVFAMQSMENYDFSGFKLNSALYHRISRGVFHRVFDTELYVFNEKIGIWDLMQ